MAFCLFGSLRSKSRSGERPGNDAGKPTALTEKPVDEALRLEPYSNAAPLNNGVDSSQASDAYLQKHKQLLEFPSDDSDNETKIDLHAAIRAVDVALNGLEIGGKRQGTPTPTRPETTPVVSQPQTRSRPGFPPRAVFPRAIRRFAKFVAPQQRAMSDALTMQQQGMQMPYQQQRSNSSTEFLMNSGELLNAQLAGCFPNGMDMRSNYSESDIQSAFWGSQGSSDGWNVHQLQNLINQQQQGLTAQNGVGRHMSADFSNNPQLQKYAMDTAINEFLMNSNDSWSSKIEVPKHGSARGDSFSSKIEFPVNCDSFTSKMSVASVREDSFSSQQQPFWPRGVEQRQVSDALLDSAYSIPESIVQELESMAEGDVPKDTATRKPDSQGDHSTSENEILYAITGTLKNALEGTLCHDDLASDLNFLTFAVRRHLMDYQSFSSGAAEKFLLVGSTLPVVCRTAMFSSHVMSQLKRFMDIISSGHPMLSNAAICVAPAASIDPQKQSEARHILTRIHRSVTGGKGSDPASQTANFASYDSAGDAHNSEVPAMKRPNSESVLRESSNPSPDTVESLTNNEQVVRSA